MTLVSNMTEVSMFSGRESNVKIYRNGSKELVDVIDSLRWAGELQERPHAATFSTSRRIKPTRVTVGGNACSWMKYVSADAPVNYDPITGSAVMLAGSAKAKPKALGTATINGITAKVEEFAVPGQGKSKFWLAEKGNFIVKLESFGPDDNDKPIMNMEVKQVSYGKPPDSLFSTPPNCTTQTQGEWSNTGVNAHAEASVEAQGSGSASLATNQTQGEATLRTSGPTGSQSSPKPVPARAAGIGATSPQATKSCDRGALAPCP